MEFIISVLAAVVVLLISTLSFPSTADVSRTAFYAWCNFSGAGNYTTNSTYEANLKSVLSDLASKTANALGFFTTSAGSDPDSVYGLALCRGDVNSTVCSSCLEVAVAGAVGRCPRAKDAALWYEYCFLRYADQKFAAQLNRGNMVYMRNANNVSSVDEEGFRDSLMVLLEELRAYAPYNSTGSPMFAAGQIDLGGHAAYDRIYGLVQCTRDIPAADCDGCLRGIYQYLPDCCANAIGGRVLAVSCNFRYEIDRFYDWAGALHVRSVNTTPPSSSAPLLPPSSPSSSSPPPLSFAPPADEENKGSVTRIILAIFVPLVTIACLVPLCYVCCWKRRRTKETSNGRMKDHALAELLFDSTTIRQATSDFCISNKLGTGGFGSVYKGILPNGQEIAVKKIIRDSIHGVEQLKNEVLLLTKLQHKNLVRLIGACLEEEEKFLAYEFVANKSLDTILFDSERKEELDWGTRYEIIKGIAQGLLYLHKESHITVIHRDLKASNVLLDSGMNPKISDFGTAKLFGEDRTHLCTEVIVGTFGYMPPEYVIRGQFSNKTDVFSFGVLVLEILTGRKRNGQFPNKTCPEYCGDLLSYVWEHWSGESISEVVDPSLGSCYRMQELERCIKIGLLCVQEQPNNRPPMSSIVPMLNGYLDPEQVPVRPTLFDSYNVYDDVTQPSSSSINVSESHSLIHH